MLRLVANKAFACTVNKKTLRCKDSKTLAFSLFALNQAAQTFQKKNVMIIMIITANVYSSQSGASFKDPDEPCNHCTCTAGSIICSRRCEEVVCSSVSSFIFCIPYTWWNHLVVSWTEHKLLLPLTRSSTRTYAWCGGSSEKYFHP